jgi:predicted TIM-barrel enzyme
VLSNTTGVAGFFGASSMERLPTETAITDRVREFKALAAT